MTAVTFENMNKLDYISDEAYKLLRTNIQFSGNDIKIICVTSSLPNEGKSSVSFHLAVSFAESEKKVIYIDADLRRSVFIGRYKPNQSVLGLSHYLSGQNTMDEIVYETNIDNLDMIFAGPLPPNPAELLGNDNFIDLLSVLRLEYDYIVIDTPPLGNVIDSAIVAKHCDGVVIVVEANTVSYKMVQKVMKQLEKGNSRILGAVLNKVDKRSGGYQHYGNRYKKYDKKYYAASRSM